MLMVIFPYFLLYFVATHILDSFGAFVLGLLVLLNLGDFLLFGLHLLQLLEISYFFLPPLEFLHFLGFELSQEVLFLFLLCLFQFFLFDTC